MTKDELSAWMKTHDVVVIEDSREIRLSAGGHTVLLAKSTDVEGSDLISCWRACVELARELGVQPPEPAVTEPDGPDLWEEFPEWLEAFSLENLTQEERAVIDQVAAGRPPDGDWEDFENLMRKLGLHAGVFDDAGTLMGLCRLILLADARRLQVMDLRANLDSNDTSGCP